MEIDSASASMGNVGDFMIGRSSIALGTLIILTAVFGMLSSGKTLSVDTQIRRVFSMH